MNRTDTAPLLCIVSIAAGLAVVPSLARVLSYDTATLVGYSAAGCAAVVYLLVSEARFEATRFGLSVATGLALFPGLGTLVGALGTGLGLVAMEPASAFRGSWRGGICAVALAPLFEEVVYRHALLLWLSRRIGVPAASLISLGTFAASHVQPWAVLGALVFGSLLTGIALRSGRLDCCIGLHTGVNLASICLGAPPDASGWIIAGLAGATATAACVSRRRRIVAQPGAPPLGGPTR